MNILKENITFQYYSIQMSPMIHVSIYDSVHFQIDLNIFFKVIHAVVIFVFETSWQ